MKSKSLATTLSAALLVTALPILAENLSFPQTRAASYDEIRKHQILGRVIIAPDGSFFMYEWSRPYDWAPAVEWMAPAAGQRMQTWLYMVDTTTTPTTSKYVMYQSPASTYYLGNLSPDGARVSVYRINHDHNIVIAGVVEHKDPVRPKITWFEPEADSAKIDKPALWISNLEFLYPAKSGGWLRAKIPEKEPEVPLGQVPPERLQAEPCTGECIALVSEKQKEILAQEQAAKARLTQKAKRKEKQPENNWGDHKEIELPKGAKLLARSATGELDVYKVDNAEWLNVLFTKDGAAPQSTFENHRKLDNIPPMPTPPPPAK